MQDRFDRSRITAFVIDFVFLGRASAPDDFVLLPFSAMIRSQDESNFILFLPPWQACCDTTGNKNPLVVTLKYSFLTTVSCGVSVLILLQ